MTNQSPEPVGGRVSILSVIALQVVLLLLPLPAFVWFGDSQYGYLGRWSATLASATCLGGALLAFGVSRCFSGNQAANGVLFGMLFRMGLPLGVTLGLLATQSPLIAAGFLGMIVVYYLYALAVETVFVVRMLDVGQALRKVA